MSNVVDDHSNALSVFNKGFFIEAAVLYQGTASAVP